MLKKISITFCLLFAFLLTLSSQSKEVEPTWESLNERGYPQWFKDAKLGVFIHWGLYSVPSWTHKEGYAEWSYKAWRSGKGSSVDFAKGVYGDDFKYEDFRDLFKAELFDASEWAKLFKDAGAKYIILTSKHHDGYALWPSKYSPNWNSVETGPKRDIVGELTKAIENEGLKIGLYYSLPEWSNPLHYWEIDPNDSIKRYVDEHMIPQFKELVSAYKPSVLFTDGEWWNTAEQWHATELISWYYNLVGDDAIVNERWGHGTEYGFVTPEYSAGITMTDRPWSEVRGLGRSFGLNRNEPLSNYLTEDFLVHHFATLVANGGGLTINVGPAADGQIPLLQQERLIQLGEWLKVNGEAIYSSSAYPVRHIEEKPISITRVDSTINFNWVRNSPDPRIRVDNFKATWTGYIQPLYDETYTFTAKADDGVRVWIDNKLVVDQWNKQEGVESFVEGAETFATTAGEIKLKKGKKYSIKVEYFEDKLNASISVRWKSKSQEEEVIPNSAFYLSAKENSAHGLNATYSSEKTYIAYTQKEDNLYAILFEWQDDECVLNVEKPSSKAKVTMLGRDGELPWKYEDGKMIIDMTPIKFTEIPCRSAWTLKISPK